MAVKSVVLTAGKWVALWVEMKAVKKGKSKAARLVATMAVLKAGRWVEH